MFGEDRNDCDVIAELLRKLFSEKITVRVASRPPIFVSRDTDREKRLRNSNRVADAVRLYQLKSNVDFIIIHRDADCIDPHYIEIAKELEKDFGGVLSLPVIAAVPAWETEAWLLLFPEAIRRTRSCWRDVPLLHNTGRIENAKEYLRRRTRTPGKKCPDYRESDAPEIARLIEFQPEDAEQLLRRSESFNRFFGRVCSVVE